MLRSRISRRLCGHVAGGLMALVVGLGFAGGALAANTVSTTVVVNGTLTASIADLTMGSVAYAHTDVAKTGTMALTADDSSGSNAGWNVTVQASAFAYSGPYGGDAIPAKNFAITMANAPTEIAGQQIHPNRGPRVPLTNSTGTLDVARKVLQADEKGGKGTYGQDLAVTLTVPADSVVGTYTGTVFVTITAAP
jgi:hypothetical protein